MTFSDICYFAQMSQKSGTHNVDEGDEEHPANVNIIAIIKILCFISIPVAVLLYRLLYIDMVNHNFTLINTAMHKMGKKARVINNVFFVAPAFIQE
ncbi:hypothetical protein [Aliivibrio kagoshimensis]|uniref:hypothetical protein n=1 Tax=Aliivibrio kagoshimensis TaxID=2910230 RepID=UPI003D0CCF20